MKVAAWAVALLLVGTALAGCAPLTPEQQAALEAQERQYALECQQRGGLLMSGSCVSRTGGR